MIAYLGEVSEQFDQSWVGILKNAEFKLVGLLSKEVGRNVEGLELRFQSEWLEMVLGEEKGCLYVSKKKLKEKERGERMRLEAKWRRKWEDITGRRPRMLESATMRLRAALEEVNVHNEREDRGIRIGVVEDETKEEAITSLMEEKNVCWRKTSLKTRTGTIQMIVIK